MSAFWIVFLVVNLLVIGVLLYLCTSNSDEALSNAMAGFFFWVCIALLAGIDGIVFLGRWLAKLL